MNVGKENILFIKTSLPSLDVIPVSWDRYIDEKNLILIRCKSLYMHFLHQFVLRVQLESVSWIYNKP